MASRNELIRGEMDPVLSKLAIGYKKVNGIARLIAPVVDTLVESGKLVSFGKEGFKLYNTERALRAEAKKIDFNWSHSTFVCEEHAIEAPIDYKEFDEAKRAGTDQILKLETRALRLTQNVLETELEKAVAGYVFDGTYYATGNKTTLTGTSKWSDVSSGVSDPIDDIDTGVAAARADMGIRPNALVMGFQSWLDLKNHPDLIAIANKRDNFGILTPQLAKDILGFKHLIIGEAVYATDAGVFTDLWGDNVALIYIPEAGELVEGITPHTVIIEESGYPQVVKYNNKKTLDIETTYKYVVKNVDTSNGYLIIDTH
jgi:hypothetical protein